jgi:hypothetical protein
MTRIVRFTLALGVVAASTAGAQGTLSTQGLGYPPGQLSTPAVSMGGAIGEVDPFSPINPASLGLMTSPIVYFQAEPEYREMNIGTRQFRSSVMRFPVFMGGLPLGERWWIALSATTLLDRTWETTTRDTQFVSNDTLPGTITDRSDGSIADLRFAVAYAPAAWLRIGVGGHAYSGRDVLRTRRVFDDSTVFAAITQQTSLSFGGNAVSIGAQTLWPRIGTVGVSYRHGGTMRVYNGNDVLGTGSVPDHLGISVAYLGLRGATIAARAARDKWSDTQGITSSGNISDAWDMGVGADITGPRFGGSPVAFRIGGRWRTLPFSLTSSSVKERTLSGGVGFPFASGRVELHLGVLRATRTSANISEGAWTISTGFGVRP